MSQLLTPTVTGTSVLDLRTPRTVQRPWADAHAEAMDLREPVFVPITPFTDDRGWSFMNLFTGSLSDQGQVNFSTQYPGAIKAWHRHRLQTDFWVCLHGHLKTGVYREEDDVAWVHVIGDRRPGALIIPPGLWHGGTAVGSSPAGLLYYVTHAYDPSEPDEERRAWDSVDGFPWTTQNK